MNIEPKENIDISCKMKNNFNAKKSCKSKTNVTKSFFESMVFTK